MIRSLVGVTGIRSFLELLKPHPWRRWEQLNLFPNFQSQTLHFDDFHMISLTDRFRPRDCFRAPQFRLELHLPAASVYQRSGCSRFTDKGFHSSTDWYAQGAQRKNQHAEEK